MPLIHSLKDSLANPPGTLAEIMDTPAARKEGDIGYRTQFAECQTLTEIDRTA